jgi:hypothetical protein
VILAILVINIENISLPLVFTPVLHRILPQVKNNLNASIVEVDALISQRVKHVIPRELFNFRDLFNFTSREEKCFENVSQEGAVDCLKFRRRLFSYFSLGVPNQFHVSRQSKYATHEIFLSGKKSKLNKIK